MRGLFFAAAVAVLLLRAPCVAASVQARVDELNLPLTVVEAPAPKAYLIFLTGDGGWQTVDRTLAEGLAPRGITTIGWSTFRYFASQRDPSEVMADLRRLLATLTDDLPIYLGGYSFGAEVVPVVLANYATVAERAAIAGLLLLAPSQSASFKVDPLDWVREPTPDPRYPVAGAVRVLSPLRTLCLGGVDDATAVCTALADIPGAAAERVPGSHHFENGMPQVIAVAIEKLFEHPRATPPSTAVRDAAPVP